MSPIVPQERDQLGAPTYFINEGLEQALRSCDITTKVLVLAANTCDKEATGI